MESDQKPRLLYFNGPWDYLGKRLYTSYILPFRRLLEQDFEVISVEGDCDLSDEVEKHRPEAILFHTGTESNNERDVSITRTECYREIPRMGYMYRDPISPSRIGPINRLLRWGVDQVFTCNRPSDSPIPFFENSFYVPWWVDDAIFRDYGEKKSYPITLAGAGWLSEQSFYTWRFPVFAQLVLKFPLFHVPVFQNHKIEDAFVGVKYARLLNQSLCAGGCGSVNRFLTLKLLEIPASRCCLITQEIDVLKAIGFVDNVNCVFVDEKSAGEKVQALLDDPVRLQEITDAGYELVHRRHTQRNRRIFIEWFRLWKTRGLEQRIVQTDPLGPLQLVSVKEPATLSNFPTESPVVEALIAGYQLISDRRIPEALEKFDWVLKVIPYVAEARLGAGICELELNNLKQSASHFLSNLDIQTKQQTSQYPDVISISYLAVVFARMSDLGHAIQVLKKSLGYKHPALNSLCWVLATKHGSLKEKNAMFQVIEGDESKTIETVHLLPSWRFREWADRWSALLP
jgi:hypothetical protein